MVGLMLIGIDIHGTIDSDVELFQKFLKELIKSGDTIYIISGPPVVDMRSELDKLGFKLNEHYNKLISIVDFLKSFRIKLWQDEKGNWWCDDTAWWESKARICHMNNIDILIDDRTEYGQTLRNVMFGLWNKHQKSIDFFLNQKNICKITGDDLWEDK